jgi:hypothetical protein
MRDLSLAAPDRAALDRHIAALVALSDGLSLDQFRVGRLNAAKRSARRVKAYLFVGTLLFLAMIAAVLVGQYRASGIAAGSGSGGHAGTVLFVASWAIALGGLGAISSIFLHLLRFIPEQVTNSGDEFEVIGRIVLGCLFSLVLSITLNRDLFDFIEWLQRDNAGVGVLPAGARGEPGANKPTLGFMVLAPFLLGYSISLVLNVLEKLVTAVEVTLGINEAKENRTTRKDPKTRLRATPRR